MRKRVHVLGLHERAYAYYAIYSLLAVCGLVLSLFIITVTDNPWLQALNAVFFGFVSVQIGMLGHDLSHGQVFKSSFANRTAALFAWALIGGLSESKWYEKHSEHHESPNHIGHDPDLEIPFVFDEKQIPDRSLFFKKWILPHQHVLFFATLPFIYITWIMFGMRHIFYNFTLRASFELFLMILHFVGLFYITFAFLPPMVAIIFLAVVFCVSGAYMSLVFAPNHKGEDILGEDEEGSWLHQIILTRNLYPSMFIFHVFGGLNLQIEHHLFPNMPRINYVQAQKQVKQFCSENQIEYSETSFFDSMKEIYVSLKEVAHAPKLAIVQPKEVFQKVDSE